MRMAISFLAGLIFGFGLLLSGMSNPAKVLNFLDVFGTWDPSLAFVMAGAVTVAYIGFRLAAHLRRPFLSQGFAGPRHQDIDARLLLGSAIFGIGWGLAGFCPGPAVVALASGSASVFIFVGAMLAGMWIARWRPRSLTGSQPVSPPNRT